MNQVFSADFGDVPVGDRDCPLCGTNNDDVAPSRFSHDVWNIRVCKTCRFVYIDKGPVYEKLAQDMAWESTTRVEEKRRREIRPLSFGFSKLTRWRMGLIGRKSMAEKVLAYVVEGNIVDLGCGDGGQLAGLADAFVPYGVEISRELAEKGDRFYGARGGSVVNAPALEGLKRFPESFFSAAFMRSYLEHEMHPRQVLAETYRTLVPGGVVLIKVPNFASLNRIIMGKRWCGFRYPDHLNYFTPGTMSEMAGRCGFEVRFPLFGRVPTNDNMHVVLKKPV